MKKHFLSIDSLPYYDTNDFTYKVLKGYYFDDTNLLLKVNKELEEYDEAKNSEPPHDRFKDSCIHLPRLNLINADEAYRFIYFPFLCPFALNVTISRKADKASIHFLRYLQGCGSDTTICRIVNEYDRPLTGEEWKRFKDALDYADYWGMKRNNKEGGIDGEHLFVDGYIRFEDRIAISERTNSVCRWLFKPSALFDVFTLVRTLSGDKRNCF